MGSSVATSSLSAIAPKVWLVYIPQENQEIRAYFKCPFFKNAANPNFYKEYHHILFVRNLSRKFSGLFLTNEIEEKYCRNTFIIIYLLSPIPQTVLWHFKELPTKYRLYMSSLWNVIYQSILCTYYVPNTVLDILKNAILSLLKGLTFSHSEKKNLSEIEIINIYNENLKLWYINYKCYKSLEKQKINKNSNI